MRAIGTTISGVMGHGSVRNNNREFTAANVDRERPGQSVLFVNEGLKQIDNDLFAYNAGKKKTRDKIYEEGATAAQRNRQIGGHKA